MYIKTICILLFINLSGFAQSIPTTAIDNILDTYKLSGSSPGLTVGIVKGDRLIYHGFRGHMNLEYNLPFNDSTVIGLASVTKQFTSACIAILQKQGKLTINDDVRTYIPELKWYGETITIKHLLNHTSGIRNHNVLLDLMGFDFEHQGYTNKSIQKLMFQQEGVNNKPGEKMLYSNTNYVLLALIIERVSKQSLPLFAETYLFDPLNMSNSFYKNNLHAVTQNKAYAYYKSDKVYQQPKSLTLCIGAGGMGSTIKDLANWTQIYLDPKHKLHYLSEFITKTDTLNNGQQMTHGKGMFTSPYKGFKTYNHSGRSTGMRSQLLVVPDLNLSIIVYSNTSELNAVDISYQLLDLWLTTETLTPKTTKQKTYSTQQLNQFTGVYQELNSDLRMTMLIENDTLKALSSFGKTAVPLLVASKNTFSRKDNPSVKYHYSLDSASVSPLMVDFGGAQFYFENIKLTSQPNANTSDFIGLYYSKELDVHYKLSLDNTSLVLNYPNSKNLVLNEGEKDVFGSNRRTKYEFIRNSKGDVDAFLVASEGTVKNIKFKKVSN